MISLRMPNAERVRELLRHPNPRQLGRLAEIYAQTGRFEEAANVAREAIALAQSTGAEQQADELRRRLKDYENAASTGSAND